MGNGGNTAESPFEKAPSVAVVEAVATEEGVPVIELCPPVYPPLYEAIDPQALNTILESTGMVGGQSQISITFPFCNYVVTIDSAGTIELEPIDS